MQSLESGVPSTINSIQGELSGAATPGTEPTPLAEVQTNREESRKAVAMQNSGTFPQERSYSSGGEGAASTAARGAVWEFATRMRQSGRKEILLSY
jgi:hypothetical protein